LTATTIALIVPNSRFSLAPQAIMRIPTTPPLLIALALALAACGDEAATTPPRDETPPTLDILAPAPADSVFLAGPVLARARCQEDDGRGCTVSVFLQGTLVAQGADSVSAAVSLAEHADRSVRLSFTAANASGGRTTAETGEIRITSTRWVPVLTVPQRLVDASPSFALYRDGDAMQLLDARTGADRSIGATTLWSAPNVVTAAGAVISFALAHGTSKPKGIREFGGSGAEMTLGQEPSARGRWAAWRNAFPTAIYRDDVLAASLTRTPDSLDITGSFPGYDLAENGAVAFSAKRTDTGPSRLYLWVGNEIRLLSPDSATVALGPVTDGASVVYGQSIPAAGGRAYRLVHHGAGGEEVLATTAEPTLPLPLELRTRSGYVMSNGWTAYHVPGATGAYRLWIRTPSGERREVLPGSGALLLYSLGPAGQLVVRDVAAGQLLLVDPPHARAIVLTPGSLDRFKWIDGQLYGMTDRTLFRLDRAGT
jgi:hypothetical protein